ncbi:alginate export family protein [Sphingomonas sp. MAH-20]|uniref:Alginate export family protein n=1 Tax=Sphingomonas horti TaxID=2682842 RepID=A0A6I4J3A6_9SPHN|nr:MULTISPECIES: alginate export family protein [Sphingomonas]MBA2919979.1 alginate export family protein [Sphingomonas sp. CGMCC 1.13658]MVO77861.1 alginate export family protein [Sphingomonas horti]
MRYNVFLLAAAASVAAPALAAPVTASFGGEVRERLEMIDAPRFGIGGTQADSYLLQRVLLHSDFHFGESARVYAQLGAHEAFGKKILSAPDEDHLDIQQLFVELNPSKSLSLRVGRQEMAFNPAQRFVSFRDGTNIRQAFDGARATLKTGRLRVDGFLTRPVALERGVFDDEPNDKQAFGGVYGAYAVGKTVSLDGYWFYLDREGASYGGVTGEEHRHSFGLRFGGAANGWDWDAEALVQRGRFAGRDIAAWGGALDLGRTFAAAPLKPRIGLRFDAGSGDADCADGTLGSFNPLFPKGPYFNEANLTSFTNLLALRPGLKIKPAKALDVEAAVQFKWRETPGDAVYVGPSAPLAGTAGGTARTIGQVYSLDAALQLNRHVALRAYYLHHSAGAAIERAGGRSVDFAMTSAQFRF